MFTSLDLLIAVFTALAATSLLALCLMLLIRNRTASRVFFYVASALGLYLSWVGFRIGLGGMLPLKMVVGVLTALACIGAFVLERVKKGNGRAFLIARIVTAAVLVAAFLNAIL